VHCNPSLYLIPKAGSGANHIRRDSLWSRPYKPIRGSHDHRRGFERAYACRSGHGCRLTCCLTPAGPVDASLEGSAPGNGALSAAAGRQVEAIGVIRTIKDKPVFLARTVKVGGEVYTIRNEHGFSCRRRRAKRAACGSTKGDHD